MEGIGFFTGLTSLTLNSNNLSEIDLSGNTALEWLNLSDNSLSSVSLGGNTALKELHLDSNNLSAVDLSKNTSLVTLTMSGNRFTAFDPSVLPGLESLILSSNRIESIDLSANTALRTLDLSGNKLRGIDLSKNTALTWLELDYNHLITLDLRAFEGFEFLSLYHQTVTDEICAWQSGGSDIFVADLSPLFPDESYEELVSSGRLTTLGDDYCVSGNIICRSSFIEYYDGTRVPYMEFRYDTGHETMTAELELVPQELRGVIPQDYILLGAGDTYAIDMERIPESLRAMIRYDAYGYVMVPVTDSGSGETLFAYEEAVPSDCVSIDGNGVIHADKEGTAFLRVYLNPGDYDTLSPRDCPGFCEVRIDVTGNVADDVIAASLPVKTADVKLYSTDYAEIHVKLERQELLKTAAAAIAGEMIPALVDEGVAIESARFAADNVNELFSLRVEDDGRLLIVPTDTALNAGKSAKYSSAIELKLRGVEEPVVTADRLSFSVKAVMPKLKAAAIKLNSHAAPADAGIRYPLEITGDDVAWIEVVSAPSWVSVKTEEKTLMFKGTAGMKASGKVVLSCSVEGCAVRVPVTVSVSCAPSVPKLGIDAKSVTINAQNDIAYVKLSADFDEYLTLVNIKKIVEGKKTYAPEDYPGFFTYFGPYYDDFEGTVFRVAFDSYSTKYSDGKDHSCKVVLELFGKEYPVTVKISGTSKKAPYVSTKVSGTLDLSIPNQEICATAEVINRSYVEDYIDCTFMDETAGKDVTYLFDYSLTQPGTVPTKVNVYFRAAGELDPSHDYRLYVSFATNLEWYENLDEPVFTDFVGQKAGAKIRVVRSDPARVAPALTAKAAGKLDTVTGEGLRVTATAKNIWPGADDADNFPRLLIFRTYTDPDSRKKVTELAFDSVNAYTDAGNDYLFFAFNTLYSGADADWTVVMNRTLDPADKFTARVECCRPGADGAEPEVIAASKDISITVFRSKAKLSVSTDTGFISSKDRYDTVALSFSNNKKACPIAAMEHDSASAKYFTYERDKSGGYSLRWKDSLLPANIAKLRGKTLNVKIGVYLYGNTSWIKPDGTVTLKIKIA